MSKLTAVNQILNLQAMLESAPAVTTNMQEFTNHFFAPGIYLRTLFIPKGHIVVGAIHKDRTMNILLKGKISVVISTGERIVAQAPFLFVAEPGQKAGYAIEDVWYATVFPNPADILNIDTLMLEHISPTHEEVAP